MFMCWNEGKALGQATNMNQPYQQVNQLGLHEKKHK